ncbi:Zinc finger BED domain-containing protein RICESLEEPER 2, partial [Bienertia sinuspersici]
TLEVAKKARTDSSSGEWKMRSAVWDHFLFTKLSEVKGEYEANCKYCNNTHYKVNSKYGTSNAKRHIDNCATYKTFLAQNPSHVTTFNQRVFMYKSVLKLCEAINYIAASDARLCTFEKCVSDSKCNFVGKLRLDCRTRWNSTYLMLKRALEARDALVLYAIVDTSFDFSLTSEEWTIVQFVRRFLVIVLDPRYKMVLVRSAFLKLYVPIEVESHVKEIYDALVEMYKFYGTSPTSSSAQSSHVRNLWGRVLTKYRSSLRTDNVEAFVTTQNWLFGYMKDHEVEECFKVIKDVMPDDVDHDSLPR